MTRRTVWSVGFLAVTVLAVAAELWAAADSNPDTMTWTELLSAHVPETVTVGAATALAVWLVPHFIDAYSQRGTSSEGGTPMPAWMTGAVRTGLQFGWTLLIGFALKHGVTLPEDAPAWLDEAVLGVVMALFVALVQWAERRGGFLGSLARVLMLGAKRPVYVKPVAPPAPVDPIRREY